MDIHSAYIVQLVYSFLPRSLLIENQYILCTYIRLNPIMVRRMIATIMQIESVVTPSGNSGHVIISYYRENKET